MHTRTETDSLGAIEVPVDRYYGAQTARALIHFDIGRDVMPRELMRSGKNDEQIAGAIGLIWNQREDRYSEIRTEEATRTKKVEMSYIGG